MKEVSPKPVGVLNLGREVVLHMINITFNDSHEGNNVLKGV